MDQLWVPRMRSLIRGSETWEEGLLFSGRASLTMILSLVGVLAQLGGGDE